MTDPLHPKADEPQMPEPVAWACLTASGRIAYFDGRPMVMPGPVGNEVHPAPLITTASAQTYAEALAAHRVERAVAAKQAESAALKREAHTWSKAAETYAKPRAPLTRQQIDDVMTQHYPLSSLLREEVDAFEACVRDIERLHGIGA